MKQIKYYIEAVNDLIFSSFDSDPNMVSTLKYVPGNAVLGYYANKFIKVNKLKMEDAHKDKTFFKLFLSGEVLFNNGYIYETDDYDKIIEFYPCPLSIQKKKSDDNSVYDLLTEDDDFDEQTRGITAFVNRALNKTKGVATRLNFHHERVRNTGSTKTGFIFNYESILGGQLFCGRIVGTEAELALLRPLLSPDHIRLGRSKTTQYGEARIYFSDMEDLDLFYNPKSSKPILTFISDVIIKDNHGNSTIDIKELEKILGVKIINSFVKSTKIESFNNAIGLRVPEETAFIAGSCFLLEKEPVASDKIIKQGIGIRRNEGYGQVALNWQNVNENIEFVANKAQKTVKPSMPAPALTKTIINAIINEKILSNVALEAMKDAETFNKKMISKSLASRLYAISESVPDYLGFKQKLNSLQNIAMNSLKDCNNRNESLKEFIDNWNNTQYNATNEYDKLKKDTNYTPPINQSDLIYKKYFKAFFITLRKNCKKSGGK